MVIFFLLSKICKNNAILKSLKKNNKIVLKNIITKKQEPHLYHKLYNNIYNNIYNNNNKKKNRNRNKNKNKIKIKKKENKEASFFYINNYKKKLFDEQGNTLILHRRNNWINKRDNIVENYKNVKAKKTSFKIIY